MAYEVDPRWSGGSQRSGNINAIGIHHFRGRGSLDSSGYPARARMRVTIAENVRVVLKLAANVGGDR